MEGGVSEAAGGGGEDEGGVWTVCEELHDDTGDGIERREASTGRWRARLNSEPGSDEPGCSGTVEGGRRARRGLFFELLKLSIRIVIEVRTKHIDKRKPRRGGRR